MQKGSVHRSYFLLWLCLVVLTSCSYGSSSGNKPTSASKDEEYLGMMNIPKATQQRWQDEMVRNAAQEQAHSELNQGS